MIEPGVFEVMGFVKGRDRVGLGVGGILMVVAGNDEVKVVERTWMGNVVGA